MKILMINEVCGVTSTGRICTDIAEELEKQGHDVKIAYGRKHVPAEYERFAINIGGPIAVFSHIVVARLFDGVGLASRFATNRFVKFIKEFDPDVIHIHNLHGYYINIPILFDYLKNCNSRIIWTLHDCWAFTGHSVYCDVVGCEKWKTQCSKCPQIREYPKSYIDRSAHNWKLKKRLFSDIPNLTIVTPSNWMADLVKESFLKMYKTVVIHNGINLEHFKRQRSNFAKAHCLEGKHILLGVANVWNSMKGYDDFIKLSQVLDSEEFCIVLVGLSMKQMTHLPNNIIGIKNVIDTDELAEIYSSADFLLNLSYCDNYPTVILESISCGTPVITYSVGGCEECLNGFGRSVPRGDIDTLVDTIYSLVSGKNAITSSFDRESLDKNIAINKYLEVIEK